MNHRVLTLGCLLCTLFTCPAPTLAAQGEKPRTSALEGVTALDKPVTMTETRIPLGEVIQKVAAATGVKLVATPSVAEEPVAVVVKDLPARELLEQLADLLDYVWIRQGQKVGTRGEAGEGWRYELWQDAAARQREEALLQAALAAAQKRLGEELQRMLEVAALPPEQRESLIAEDDRRIKEILRLPPAQRDAIGRQEWLRRKRAMAARQLAEPVPRALATLLGRLSPEQWAALRAGQTLVFSTDPQPGQSPLPAGMVAAFSAARPEIGNGMGPSSIPEIAAEERRTKQELAQQWAAAPGYQVIIQLDTTQARKDGSLSLRSCAIPLGGNPNLSGRYRVGDGTSLSLGAGPYQIYPKPDAPRPPEQQAALDRDPVLGTKKQFKVVPRPPAPGDAFSPIIDRPLRDLLPDLARSYGVSIISDAYWLDRMPPPLPGDAPVALATLLDRWAFPQHRWDWNGKLVRLRFRDWPFVRPREVPFRFVRRWQALPDRNSALPLADLAEAAASLTDQQLMDAFAIVDVPSLIYLYYARHALRLYASLSPAQQQALRRGRSLPAAAMTARQRELFLSPLLPNEPGPEAPLPDASPPPLPEISRASRFSLTSERVVRIYENHGNYTRVRTEPAPPAPPPAPAAGAPAPPASRVAAAPDAAPPTRSVRVTRYSGTDVTFHFTYTPEWRIDAFASVASTP